MSVKLFRFTMLVVMAFLAIASFQIGRIYGTNEIMSHICNGTMMQTAIECKDGGFFKND